MSRRRSGGLPPGKLSITGARKRLGVSYEVMTRLVNSGQIPHHREGDHLYFDEATIDAIVARMPDAAVAEAAERRLSELREQQSMMATSITRPADKQVRHRAGEDDHLEIGIPKRNAKRKSGAPAKSVDVLPPVPVPHVAGEIIGPRPCANEVCRQLFRNPAWDFRQPGTSSRDRFCSRSCAQQQAEREYARAKRAGTQRRVNGL